MFDPSEGGAELGACIIGKELRAQRADHRWKRQSLLLSLGAAAPVCAAAAEPQLCASGLVSSVRLTAGLLGRKVPGAFLPEDRLCLRGGPARAAMCSGGTHHVWPRLRGLRLSPAHPPLEF